MTTGLDTRPAICGVTIYSPRPDLLASFYAKVLATPLDGGVDHLSGEAMFRTQVHGVEFEVIGTSTAVGSGAVQPSVQVADGDVRAAVQRALEADGSVHLGAATHDWGTFAIVVDPDGNRLGLYAPSEEA
jgi:predicted enzyme related to lactoylglutathione lyase